MELERLSRAYVDTGALYTASDLCIADVLAEGPVPVSAIAEATGTNASMLNRLLSFLVSRGVFERAETHSKETGETCYRNSYISELMRSGTPNSLRDITLLPKWEGPAWMHMSAALKVSEQTPAFELCHKQTFWDYLKERPEDSETFSGAMTSYTEIRRDVLRKIDPQVAAGEGALLVDVGGAEGMVLAFILEELRPLARGIVMDLPSVAMGAHAASLLVC